MSKKFFLVVGARPNYMKAAPLIEALTEYPEIQTFLIHTGQHYDEVMNDVFFKDLDLPKPDYYLGVGSGTHAQQTAKTMIRFEKLLLEQSPDLVVVFGDVNSTVACALDSAKLYIPVAHVEAGLRSFDRNMPEEINRLLTDHISDFLFTTSHYDNDNLIKEGIPQDKIYLVGNVMVDSLNKHIHKAAKSPILSKLGLKENNTLQSYVLMTLHRPSNVDDPNVFGKLLDAIQEISQTIPVVFPAHPRTQARIKEFGFQDKVRFLEKEHSPRTLPAQKGINVIPPMGYLDFLCLTSHARLILTDSGGIQAESTVLGVPCLTLRDNTEWTITLEKGTNTLVGTDPDRIKGEAQRFLDSKPLESHIPEFWDGKAAERIAKVLAGK